MRPTAASFPYGRQTRPGEALLFTPWAIGTLLFATRWIGAKLFLIYLFGWEKVRQEHLTLPAMPKGHPWPVSNGDVVTGDFFIHYLIFTVCWLAIFAGTYPIVRLLLPRPRQA